MANSVEPTPGGSSPRLTDVISLGVLAEVVGRDQIEDVLEATGRREQRSRRLPAHVMVRFCLAMCLFYDDDYEEVMRKLVGSLKEMGSWRDDWEVPTTSAITHARNRAVLFWPAEQFDPLSNSIGSWPARQRWPKPTGRTGVTPHLDKAWAPAIVRVRPRRLGRISRRTGLCRPPLRKPRPTHTSAKATHST
jgi:Insertion element 4 transposase N-terminal